MSTLRCYDKCKNTSSDKSKNIIIAAAIRHALICPNQAAIITPNGDKSLSRLKGREAKTASVFIHYWATAVGKVKNISDLIRWIIVCFLCVAFDQLVSIEEAPLSRDFLPDWPQTKLLGWFSSLYMKRNQRRWDYIYKKKVEDTDGRKIRTPAESNIYRYIIKVMKL